MTLFRIEKGTSIKEVREKPFRLEKDIQELCERNIGDLFGLKLITSEFSLHNSRIDTLAFDSQKRSFVIME